MNKTVKEEKVRDEKSCNFYDLKTMRERERERLVPMDVIIIKVISNSLKNKKRNSLSTCSTLHIFSETIFEKEYYDHSIP